MSLKTEVCNYLSHFWRSRPVRIWMQKNDHIVLKVPLCFKNARSRYFQIEWSSSSEAET